MAAKHGHKTVSIIRWTARILALFFTISFFFWNTIFVVGSVVTDLHGAITADLILPVALGILVLAADAVSWWRERLGGILFILISAAYVVILLINGWSGVHIISMTSVIKGVFIDWAILGLPLLIAGILFLIAARQSRKDSLSLAPESDVMSSN
jgi:hypothetical protein